MPGNLSSLIWGIITLIAVFLLLASCVIALVLYHNRKVREYEDQFRLLFNRAFDTLLLFDADGKVMNSNEAASQLLGYRPGELLGLRLEDLFSRTELLGFRGRIQDVLASGADAVTEVRLRNNIGHEIETEAGCRAIKIGHHDCVLASFRDLTARKEIQRELESKNNALKEVLANLEGEKLQVKQSVAENIDQVVLPIVHKMPSADGSLNTEYYRVLEDTLTEMSLSLGGLNKVMAKLSPREVEVSRMIKTGATTKEVAQALNLSIKTVNKHRQNIRRKLVITKKGVNLTSLLGEGGE